MPSGIIQESWVSGLKEPAGIAISNDFLYVSSVTRSLIYKINIHNGSYESWKSIFSFCNSLAIYHDEILYACSFIEENIQEIHLENTYSKPSYITYDNAYGITITGNTMYVSNQQGNFISQIDLLESTNSNQFEKSISSLSKH